MHKQILNFSKFNYTIIKPFQDAVVSNVKLITHCIKLNKLRSKKVRSLIG